jgi:parvulin-like peptidyl-prolyl isomerase
MIRKFKGKKFHRKIKHDLRKTSKQVRELVPETVVEKAANLNPLAAPDAPALTEDVEPITNETIAEHRESVLSGARKYIYPLQHSKRRILVVSSFITGVAVAAFLAYCVLGLYKFYQYNTFLYRVTQVVPFPIARSDGRFISYENYLFELRHYVHYYQSQLGRDFSGDDKAQLVAFRKQALQDSVNEAYIKILAQNNHVSVSNKEVNERVTEVRNQNRLGSNDKVFADVLHDYWGWSISDFQRSLKSQILSEDVVAKLDTADEARAHSVLVQLASGGDFATLAKTYSDAPDKANGGAYGFTITDSNPNVPPQVITELFKLKPGEISPVVNAGTTLEIVQLTGRTGNTLTASHISFSLQPISTYIDPLKAQHPTHKYVKF